MAPRAKLSLKARLYHWLRPYLMHNPDPNEDFNCANCQQPLLRRVLFCSDFCTEQFLEKSGTPRLLEKRKRHEIPDPPRR